MIIPIRRETLFPATLGTMEVDGAPFGPTLERPWKDNAPRISCIPPGTYPVTVVQSPKFKRQMIRLLDVPGRDGILIHNANHVEELQGCIAVAAQRFGLWGLMMGRSEQLKALVKAAIKRDETVTIEITTPKGPQ